MNDNRSEQLKDYLEFVRKRLQSTEFHAEDKLKKIDELAEAVFHARKSFRKKAELKSSTNA